MICKECMHYEYDDDQDRYQGKRRYRCTNLKHTQRLNFITGHYYVDSEACIDHNERGQCVCWSQRTEEV